MKKSKVCLTVTAALIASALGLTGCTNKEQQPEVVYGPPETMEETQPIQDVYGPPIESEEGTTPTQDVDNPPIEK